MFMIKFEEAYKIVISKARERETTTIDLNDCLNYVLAKDVLSDIEMPPFNKSAMDGFACRREDVNSLLQIIETIPAGTIPLKKIDRNQCAKIMTGAKVPEGADCVIKVEDTQEQKDNTVKILKANSNNNIAYKAEDVKLHQCVLEKGTLIKPQTIAILASVGAVNIKVFKKPLVGVISTGSELVEPTQMPKVGQIRNSNSYQLIAQLQNIDIPAKYYGIAEDTEEVTYDILLKAINECDVILLSGGVSMGEFDFVLKVFEKLGIKIHFDQVAVKPGKPTSFGTIKDKYIFGLPGNPVSSFIQFELLVKPLIFKIIGNHQTQKEMILPMEKEYKRRNTSRRSWIPVQITSEGKVIPTNYHGSAHIHSLTQSDGIIDIQINENTLKEGDLVNVRLI